MEQRKTVEYVLIGLAVILALVGSYFGVRLPAPDVPEPGSRSANTPCYLEQGGTGLVCGSGGGVTIGSGASLTVASGATETHAAAISATSTLGVTGLTTLTGGAAISQTLTFPAMAATTVTNGAAFAISGTFQPITAAGAVTPTITIPAAGRYACIYNTSSNAILIQDTGNQVLTADATLGQYDVLCGYSDGTRFIETSRANN
jgi:hypothetical protein